MVSFVHSNHQAKRFNTFSCLLGTNSPCSNPHTWKGSFARKSKSCQSANHAPEKLAWIQAFLDTPVTGKNLSWSGARAKFTVTTRAFFTFSRNVSLKRLLDASNSPQQTNKNRGQGDARTIWMLSSSPGFGPYPCREKNVSNLSRLHRNALLLATCAVEPFWMLPLCLQTR